LHIFHQSCEMEISLRESFRKNLAKVVRYSRMQAMPYFVYGAESDLKLFLFEKMNLVGASSRPLQFMNNKC